MARIGFLGTGAIATAMVETLSSSGHQIIVSERNVDTSAQLAARFDEVSVASNSDIVAQSDIVIVCLAADVARSVLPELEFDSKTHVISVVAGLGLKELTSLCSPATDIAMMIPLPSLPTGNSPVVVYPESAVARDLFDQKSQLCIAPDEAAFTAHSVTTALLLSILDQISTAAKWLGSHTGDEDAAAGYLADLFSSYFTLMHQNSDQSLDVIMAGLAVDGGMNDTLSKRLGDAGTNDVIVATFNEFATRFGLPRHEV